VIASLLLLASILENGATPAEAQAAGAPIALFRSACLNGALRLPRHAVSVVEYRRLPREARNAIDAASPVRSDGFVPRVTPIRNTIYDLGTERRIFLIPPATNAAPTNINPRDISSSCIVIWRGDNLEEAASVFFENSSLPGAPPVEHDRTVHYPILRYLSVFRGGLNLTVAANGEWIVLRAEPEHKPEDH
jgi:hypothetical protein